MKGDIRWGERAEKERQLVKLVGDQNPSPEAPPSSKRGGSKGNVRGSMEKSWGAEPLRERRSEKVTPSDTSSPRGSEVPFESQGVLAIDITHNEEIPGEVANGGGKGVV